MTPVLVSFGLTAVLTPIVLAVLRRRRVIDVPNERSSHTIPTPRGGGLAAAIGMGAGLVVASGGQGRWRGALLAALFVVALLGLAEDLVGLPVLWRLALQVAAAGLVSVWLLSDLDRPPLLGLLMVVAGLVFLAGYVNAFNFMDGINGISVIHAATVGATWWVVGEHEGVPSFATAAAVVAAAALAFLPFNFPRARVFLGDVGSYAFGAALGTLALVALLRRVPPEAILAPLSLYLADTGTTLVRRSRRGEVWYRPHREHVYQQLVLLGWSHVATTSMIGAVTVVLGVLGSVSLGTSIGLRALADLAIVALLVAYLRAPALVRRARARGAPAWA